MDRHVFQVGDKGKTRRGESYEVIAVEKRAHKHQIVALIDEHRLACRYSSGSLSTSGCLLDSDLMPPTRQAFVNLVYTDAPFMHGEREPRVISTRPYQTADAARCDAGRMQCVAIAVPVELPA